MPAHPQTPHLRARLLTSSSERVFCSFPKEAAYLQPLGKRGACPPPYILYLVPAVREDVWFKRVSGSFLGAWYSYSIYITWMCFLVDTLIGALVWGTKQNSTVFIKHTPGVLLRACNWKGAPKTGTSPCRSNVQKQYDLHDFVKIPSIISWRTQDTLFTLARINGKVTAKEITKNDVTDLRCRPLT